MPPSTPPRRLNLGDLAILVGAAAGAFALARRSLADEPEALLFYRFRGANGDQTGVHYDGNFAALVSEILGQGLILASLALIAIRLRQPRPGWRRLWRQPGWVASTTGLLAAALVFGVVQVQNGVATASIRRGVRSTAHETIRLSLFPDEAATACGLAVLVAWLILGCTGARRPERSTIDRLGRVVGVGWVALPLLRLGSGIVRVAWP